MSRFVRRNARAVLVGAVVAVMAGALPALAAFDAKNADKVDGIHASKTPAANKLLAPNKSKKFPASVIPKIAAAKQADNANKLDGLDSSAFGRVASDTVTSQSFPHNALTTILETTLTPPAASNFIKIDGAVSLYVPTASGCLCYYQLQIWVNGVQVGADNYVTVASTGEW